RTGGRRADVRLAWGAASRRPRVAQAWPAFKRLRFRPKSFRFQGLNARLIVPAAPGFSRAPPPGTLRGFEHGGVDPKPTPPGEGKHLGSNAQDEHEQRLALFIDFENIAIGVRDAHYRKFDVNLVLERLLDKGKLLVKKAYADWSRYADYKRSFHEAAIELI